MEEFSRAQRSTLGIASTGYVRTYRPPPHVSGDEMLHFKQPCVSLPGLLEIKTTTTNPILSFDLISMSTLTWTTEKELEREIKTKGYQFRWQKNIKIYRGGEKKGKC